MKPDAASPAFSLWRPGDRAAEPAPDGSRVTPMLRCPAGSMARFELAADGISARVRHPVVDELWYVESGQGEIWRRAGGIESTDLLSEGLCIDIPRGVAFQFRAGPSGLSIIAVTMPAWSGDHDAEPVDGSTWPA